MSRLYFWKDQDDFSKIITDEEIINIIGTKGSGKTTTSLEYLEEKDTIIVNCDRLFDMPEEVDKDEKFFEIKEYLDKKYDSIPKGEEFVNYYNDIVDSILKKKKKGIIEGNVIQTISPNKLRGKIVIKRTGVCKSFLRAVKRDYQNSYFMNLEKKEHPYFYRVTRLYKITKRRSNIFKQAKEIETIIEQLENKE